MYMEQLKQDYRTKELSRVKMYNTDFSGQDLSKLRMRQSLFHNCNFDKADMTETDCEGTDFFGSTFRETVMYRTNGKDAKFAGTIFEPKDAFGLTITCSCKTFNGMHISNIWWYNFIMYALLMKPGTDEDTKKLHNGLIQVIGPARYVKLKALFSKREI
jgi:uncharacterized protein YjbI with pentapeptide repeats